MSIYGWRSADAGNRSSVLSKARIYSEKCVRQTIAVLAVLLLASVLGVSGAAAYGGGGFYGSGRGTRPSRDDHSSLDDGKISRHQPALHRKVFQTTNGSDPNSPM